MDAAITDYLRQLGEDGPRRHANWDGPRFDAYCGTLLPELCERLSPACGPTLASFAMLIEQGIGEGYLRSPPEVAPANLLEFCLRVWLPDALPQTPPAERRPLLARVWNLCEGLLREPAWVNAYLMARVGEFRKDRAPEAFLVDALRPLLEPVRSARWEGPFRVTLLSLRPADDAFLPGEMQLAAPAVLVVTDRRRPARLGIHLRREGRSTILGPFAAAEPFPDEPPGVNVAWGGNTARVGSEKLSLPALERPFRWTAVRAGFLVVSAPDSQKLWIAESAA
jgi:hypothetical protein